MKFKWDKKYLYLGVTAFLVVVASMIFHNIITGSSSILTGISKIISVLTPIIDGLVLAYLMNPILNFYENSVLSKITDKLRYFNPEDNPAKGKRRIRNCSVALTFVTTVLIVTIFFQMVIPQIADSIQSIIKLFPTYLNNLNAWAEQVFKNYPFLESSLVSFIGDYTKDMNEFLRRNVLPHVNTVLTSVSLSLMRILTFTWNLLIGLIISIYIMANRELFAAQFKKLLYAYFNQRTAGNIIGECAFIHRTFSSFIVGKIVDSAIIGVLCFFAASIIGTPYPVLISVIIGVTNIIPVFGPFIGAIPCALLVLLVDPLQCLYFILMIFVLQQLDGNFIGPKILGGSTGLSSFWVIFAITLGGGLFGVVGMFLGIPIFAVLYAEFKRRVNKHLKFKSLSENTNDYFKNFDSSNRQAFVNAITVKKNEEAPSAADAPDSTQ